MAWWKWNVADLGTVAVFLTQVSRTSVLPTSACTLHVHNSFGVVRAQHAQVREFDKRWSQTSWNTDTHDVTGRAYIAFDRCEPHAQSKLLEMVTCSRQTLHSRSWCRQGVCTGWLWKRVAATLVCVGNAVFGPAALRLSAQEALWEVAWGDESLTVMQ